MQGGVTWQVVATVAGIIATCVLFVLGYLFAERRRKEELTLEVWKTWSSSEMRLIRVAIGNRFKIISHEEADEPVYTLIGYDDLIKGKDEAESQVLAMQFGSLAHYLMELGVLMQRKFLSPALFASLFGLSLSHWRARFRAMEYDRSRKDQIEHRATHKALLEAVDRLLGR